MADRIKDPAAIPDLLLEKYALDELAPAARADLERRLNDDPAAQARLAELRRSNAEILAAYPPEKAVADIERRARREAAERQATPRKSLVRFAPAFATLAMAAVVVLILKPPVTPPQGDANTKLEAVRLKGLKPSLLVFEKPAAGEKPRALKDGATVRAHAVLQIAYVAAGKPHGVVVSIDGRGTATLHQPSAASEPAKLEPGQVSLPNAYELDDAPRFERFFFVTATAPIDVAQVVTAARKLAGDSAQAQSARLPLPPNFEQTSLLLIKEGAQP